MTINIYAVGTQRFWDNHTSASSQMYDIRDRIRDEWEEHIEDGSGDYDVSLTVYFEGGAEVPETPLPSAGLNDRLYAADDWLDNNESTLYNNADSIIVVDHYGADSNTYGWGYLGTAGNSNNICGIVDTHYEDNNNYPSELSGVQAPGVAFHEVLHTFDARHPEDVTTWYNQLSNDLISIMYSWDGVGCNNNGNTGQVSFGVSVCTRSSVRSYIDNHSNL